MTEPTNSEPATSSGLLRIAGLVMILAGAGALVAAALGAAFRGDKMPAAVIYANLGVAVLQLGLGAPVMQRRRAAWAYAVSIWAVMLLVNLLGLAPMLRSGTPGLVSAAFAGVHAVLGVLLIIGRDELGKPGH